MAGRRRSQKTEYYFDYSLLFIILFLTGFGLVMIYSASAYDATTQNLNEDYYLMHQIIVLVQILRRRIVSAGGINHNQSEACQKQDDEQKTVIKIVFCFLRSSPSCHLLTPSGYLHIP